MFQSISMYDRYDSESIMNAPIATTAFRFEFLISCSNN